MQLDPFLNADAAFGAEIDAGWLALFLQQLDEHVLPLRDGQAGELDDQPAAVLIDGEAGKAVAFAEDQAAGVAWTGELQHVATEADRLGEPFSEESFIERLIDFPGVEADAKPALVVEEAVGDEAAAVREDLHG